MNQPRPVFEVQRGETYRLVYKIEEDPNNIITGTEVVRSAAKKIAMPNAPLPPDTAPDAFELTPLYQPAGFGEPARWYFTLSATDSLAAENGYYAVDARIELAGGNVQMTTPIVLHLVQFITADA
jgi:hypothetical protein